MKFNFYNAAQQLYESLERRTEPKMDVNEVKGESTEVIDLKRDENAVTDIVKNSNGKNVSVFNVSLKRLSSFLLKQTNQRTYVLRTRFFIFEIRLGMK